MAIIRGNGGGLTPPFPLAIHRPADACHAPSMSAAEQPGVRLQVRADGGLAVLSDEVTIAGGGAHNGLTEVAGCHSLSGK